ncbi:MAG: methyltransferase domain-containing protein [Candidatus Solibacter usitatus]|nr:methyltransferase domain-containing protein [Candidatus Solibacter usitatus]
MGEFTGERVIPGQVDADLLNEHLARYVFAARLSKRKRVLDAGCGVGFGALELARAAADVLAVDRAAEAIEYAREHYAQPNLRFEQADCSALPAGDGSIDLVIAFEVLEHLEDWRGFLREARRVLAPGGQFIVSTPNKLYYAESRQRAGPNPFHVHEFEFEEFKSELAAVFPHVSLFLENHAAGVVFQPVEPDATSEVRVEGTCAPPESHFFVAVCASRPQTGAPTFVYVPSAANVLRARERHIALLEAELRIKNQWLEKAKAELAGLNEDHQRVLAMFRRQTEELQERNRWAESLNRELAERGERVEQLQSELGAEQTAAREMARAYECKVAELEAENVRKTEWARDTEARLSKELEERGAQLQQCVDLLHQAERTVEERTAWARRLESEKAAVEAQLSLVRGSRWIKLGRRFGLGPELER